MFGSPKQLADHLFEEIPYSQASDEAKKRVTAALESEYDAFIGKGSNEMQAMGSLMKHYGTLDSAAELAGFTDTRIIRTQDNAVGKGKFKKDFNAYRIFSLIASCVFSCDILSLIYFVIYRSAPILINVLIYTAVSAVFLIPCRRISKRYAYANVRLMPNARELFCIYSDRFKKRTINSIPLLLVLLGNFISLSFERAMLSDMNHEELINLIVTNSLYLQAGIIVLMKNLLYTAFLGHIANDDSKYRTRRYLVRAVISAAAFIPFAIIVTVITGRFIHNQYPILYILIAVYIAAFIFVNCKKRPSIVIKNIRVNKMRIAAAAAAVLVFFGISSMKADKWLLQPYIMTVSEVGHIDRDISYDEKSGVYTITADEGDFRILHLTDIHIGGSAFSVQKDYKALDACYKLIEETRPDLVVITGDLVFPLGIMSLSLNNKTPVMQFASFMKNIGIPWAFTYGNHDTESVATGTREDICKLYESLSFINSGKLLYPDVQPDITGRSNQMIMIKNPDGSERQALFLIDSNDYTGNGINDYDYIHDDQVEWYARQVKSLSAGTKSMAFFHIPLREYRYAYEQYENGDDTVRYYFGEIGETMINPICCSDHESKFFDKALELGSTQAMFCGHDHYNNISMGYKGIRLTYGMSIDYLAMPGISKDHKQRGGELITLHKDGSYDLTQIPLDSLSGKK